MKKRYIKSFKNIALEISKLSTCAYRKVGAIIIKDNRIIAEGFNGTPRGTLQCNEVHELIELLTYRKIKSGLNNHFAKIQHKPKNGLLYFWQRVPKYNKNLTIEDRLIKKYGFEIYNYAKNKVLEVLNAKEQLFENGLYDYLYAMDYNDLTEKFFKKINFIHNVGEVHAEMNAITTAARYGIELEGSEIIVTHKPCIDCAKSIVQTGIKQVYYIEDYKSSIHDKFKDSEEFFNLTGVKLIRI